MDEEGDCDGPRAGATTPVSVPRGEFSVESSTHAPHCEAQSCAEAKGGFGSGAQGGGERATGNGAGER